MDHYYFFCSAWGFTTKRFNSLDQAVILLQEPITNPFVTIDPKYWFIVTLAFAGSLLVEWRRSKQSNPESGIANVLTGAAIGGIFGVVSVLEPKLFYFTETTRICLCFFWGAAGRIIFVGFVKLIENPKEGIANIMAMIPKEFLGDVIDLIKSRYFSKGGDDNHTEK